MTVIPFGNYQPNKCNGEVYGTRNSDLTRDGKPLSWYVVFLVFPSGRAECDCGDYATLAEAEAAAHRRAIKHNAVFVPSSKRERA